MKKTDKVDILNSMKEKNSKQVAVLPSNTARKKSKKRDTVNLSTLFPDFRSRNFLSKVEKDSFTYLTELRDSYLNKGLVLYVGAGVSRSVGLPSWPELIRALSVTMMGRRVESAISNLRGLSDDKKFEKLIQLQDQVDRRTESDKPILMMARAVKDDLREQLPLEMARILYRPVYRRLSYSYESRVSKFRHRRAVPYISSDLLDSIVDLCRAERDSKGVQAIINYNYDDILDERLRSASVRCKTVISGKDRIDSGILPSYHVHGLLSARKFVEEKDARFQGNFVFSEDEYHAEYSDPYKWSNMLQMSLLGRYSGLFVGLSLEDPNIRRLIDVTHKQYPENINYAILPRKVPNDPSKRSSDSVMRNLFENVESSSFDKIGVKVIWVNHFSEIPKLLKAICGSTS